MRRSVLLSSAAVLALSSTLALAEGTPRRDQAQDQNAPAAQQQAPAAQQQAPAGRAQTPTSSQSTQSAPPSGSNQSSQSQSQQPSNNAASQQRQNNQNAQQQPAQPNQNAQQQPAQSNQQPAQRSTQSPAGANQQGAQAPQSGQPRQAAQGAATTAQQRTQIATTIRQQNVTPVRVNFALNVGVAVPSSIRVSPLPDAIVAIVPQYRGYSYFVTDERIVIIEPSSHQIVEVLPYEGGGRAAAAPAPQRKVQFSNEQRQSIKKHAVAKRTATTGSGPRKRVVVEDEVPSSVTLEEFPDVVVKEMPSVRSYRYYRNDDDVVVVDPGSRRVIDVIE